MSLIEFFQKEVIDSKLSDPLIDGELVSGVDVLKDTVPNPIFKYKTPFLFNILFSKNEEISISKLNTFLKLASLDLSTINRSTSFLNVQVQSLNELYNYKLQSIQFQLDYLNSSTLTLPVGTFKESFRTNESVNLALTSVEVDNTLGQANLPKQSFDNIIQTKLISLTNYTLPTGVDNLGTGPMDMFDGKDNTSFLLSYLSDSLNPTVVEFGFGSKPLTSIVLSPVNASTVLVSVYTQGTWKDVINTTLSQKQEFYINQEEVTAIRLKLKPTQGSFPRICGLKECLLYSNTFSTVGQLFTTEITTNTKYNEINLGWSSDEPNDSKISAFYATDVIGPWISVDNNKWKQISNTDTTNLNFTSADLVSPSYAQTLFSKPLTIEASFYDENIIIGNRQFRVDSYQKDYKESGYKYRINHPEDFKNNSTKFAYQEVNTYGFNVDGVLVQEKGQTNVQNTLSLGKLGTELVFQRKVDDAVYPKVSDNKYKETVFVIQSESLVSHIFQYNNHYKFTCYVYSNKDTVYPDANFWFLQGFRTLGSKAFQAQDKVYGTFSFYINDELVISSDKPKTIYSDNTIETGGSDGTKFTLSLKKGINKVEYIISPYDYKNYDISAFDTNLGPYLQLSITPSLFDEDINSFGDFDIERIYAEPTSTSKDEFDLLWNLQSSPTNWAWSNDRKALLFNYKPNQPIDGYFKGGPVKYNFSYKNINGMTTNPMYLKFVFKASSSKLTPVLKDYTLQLK